MRTRIEGLSIRDLLKEHLEANYPDAFVLVIYGCDVRDEAVDCEYWDLIKTTLTEYGREIPSSMVCDEFIFMEMDDNMAKAIINRHDKAPIRLELWHGSTCFHENR